jgi:uncharacterized membrane protein
MAIRNPVQWGVEQFRVTGKAARPTIGAAQQAEQAELAPPEVRRIEVADLLDALAKGLEDFGANRTDVLFLCLLYPLIGVVLARLTAGYDMLPLLFPLASGFALVGPLAAVGLYEMSRRREQGAQASWADAFGVVRSPSFGGIMMLGLLLIEVFVLWLMAAFAIYHATLGPTPPASVGAFVHDVLLTPAGWVMIGAGFAVGFLFALFVLAVGAVSFPLQLDRNVGVEQAMRTSIRAMRVNPGPMAAWGLIVAGVLVAGSIPLFIGLVIALPVLGHATWHLYRKVIA